MTTATAGTRRRRALLIAGCGIAAVLAWTIHHIIGLTIGHGHGGRYAAIYTAACMSLLWQTILYSAERPKTATGRQLARLDRLRVVIPVPVYNEDPAALAACLASLIHQHRKPDIVFVVDDGSKNVDYTTVRTQFLTDAAAAGIQAHWERKPNGGKRSAQGLVFRATAHTADIYLTVDSDAFLPPDAIHQVLLPFADPRVQSVAGLVLASNNAGVYPRLRDAHTTRGHRAARTLAAGQEILARVSDLWFVTGQLVDRSAASTMGAVLVNSGPLAAYRADLVLDNLASYLGETFFGRPVEFSDDSMLTIYALQRGRCVQQPTAVAFTLMPETISHSNRQYLRWMRGAFIRSWWRIRYLPLTGYAFWAHAFGWLQMAVSTFLFVDLFLISPATGRGLPPSLFLIPVLVGYGQGLRYLALRRSDQTLASQLATYALAPVATLWAFTVLRVVRWYAIATCLKGDWGTRATVEITLEPTA